MKIQPLKNYKKINMLQIENGFSPSTFVSRGNLQSVTENGSFYFEIKPQKLQNGLVKNFLFKTKKNKKPSCTPWIVQKTKDHRYVWRGSTQVDQFDFQYLLRFILEPRNFQDQCPAILINAGSHGGQSGKNANQAGLMQFSDIKIRDQIVHTIANLVEDKNIKTKLTKQNIGHKIMVNLVTIYRPCIYPQNADHIIDVQCKGAYSKIPAQSLHPPNQKAPIIEKDLLFLYDGSAERLMKKKNKQKQQQQIEKQRIRKQTQSWNDYCQSLSPEQLKQLKREIIKQEKQEKMNETAEKLNKLKKQLNNMGFQYDDIRQEPKNVMVQNNKKYINNNYQQSNNNYKQNNNNYQQNNSNYQQNNNNYQQNSNKNYNNDFDVSNQNYDDNDDDNDYDDNDYNENGDDDENNYNGFQNNNKYNNNYNSNNNFDDSDQDQDYRQQKNQYNNQYSYNSNNDSDDDYE